MLASETYYVPLHLFHSLADARLDTNHTFGMNFTKRTKYSLISMAPPMKQLNMFGKSCLETGTILETIEWQNRAQ